MTNCYDCNHCEVCKWIDEFKDKDVCDFYETLEKHDEEVIKETVESIWGKPPYTEMLDKIRAEIEQNAYPIVHGVNNRELGMTLYGILEVIDKYKAESEDKE